MSDSTVSGLGDESERHLYEQNPWSTAVQPPCGGRPGLTVDFEVVCDAVVKARKRSGETITDIAARFGVSRRWIHKVE